jgi:hypothetical protein
MSQRTFAVANCGIRSNFLSLATQLLQHAGGDADLIMKAGAYLVARCVQHDSKEAIKHWNFVRIENPRVGGSNPPSGTIFSGKDIRL